MATHHGAQPPMMLMMMMLMLMLMMLMMMRKEQVPTFWSAPVFLLLTNGWIIRRVQCRGQACLLHAECYENSVEDKPFY